jgi:hypothetical protein
MYCALGSSIMGQLLREEVFGCSGSSSDIVAPLIIGIVRSSSMRDEYGLVSVFTMFDKGVLGAAGAGGGGVWGGGEIAEKCPSAVILRRSMS